MMAQHCAAAHCTPEKEMESAVLDSTRCRGGWVGVGGGAQKREGRQG